MPALDRADRYSTVAIWFHWTIALLVIVNLAVGILHGSIPAMRAWMPGHKSIGITVLVLTVGRIAWRLAHRPPMLPAHSRTWEKGRTHHALDALRPADRDAADRLADSIGHRQALGARPVRAVRHSLSAGVEAVGGFGHSAQGLLGWLTLALVVLHVAAALRHHLLGDTVLVRMAPVAPC